MFEKEAEEYLKKDGTKAEQILNALNEISPIKITLKQFPFILAMLEQTFKDGAEVGYSKANEWHYPSKGEYPIDKTEMLVYFKYADYEYPCKTFGFYNGHFWDTKRGDVSNKEVIAWKEIVLSKESE